MVLPEHFGRSSMCQGPETEVERSRGSQGWHKPVVEVRFLPSDWLAVATSSPYLNSLITKIKQKESPQG